MLVVASRWLPFKHIFTIHETQYGIVYIAYEVRVNVNAYGF